VGDEIGDWGENPQNYRSDIFVGCVRCFVEVRQKRNRVLKRAARVADNSDVVRRHFFLVISNRKDITDMGSASTGDAIRNMSHWGNTLGQRTISAATKKMTDEFGSLTFNDEAQRARLPKDVYRALRRAVAHGEPIDSTVADTIASALKDWAV